MAYKTPKNTPIFNPEDKKKEIALKVTKEIVVKFIEMGRVSPDTFDVVFSSVHKTVSRCFSDNKDQQN